MRIKLLAAVTVCSAACVAAPLASAQHGGHHRIVTPSDLKWSDVGSLPPGAKVAVIEGDPGKAGLVTIRIKLPPKYKIAPHHHGTAQGAALRSGKLSNGRAEECDQKATP